jgi:hypothetical protein
MRIKIAALLRRIATWLTPAYPDKLWERAVELTNAADSFIDASGEYKRAKVYAQLIKDFPTMRRRDIALLIEVIMQERN